MRRVSRVRWLGGNRVAHFHQDKGDDGDQQKAGKAQQEDAADGENGGGEHHAKRKRREHVVVARALQRKQAYDHDKKHQVNTGGEKGAGKKEIIGQVDKDVDKRQKVSPALGDEKLASREKLISAKRQG